MMKQISFASDFVDATLLAAFFLAAFFAIGQASSNAARDESCYGPVASRNDRASGHNIERNNSWLGGQIRLNLRELLQRSPEILNDLSSNNGRIRKILRIFKALIPQPKHIQVRLVAGDQLVIRIAAPSAIRILLGPHRHALVTVLGMVAADKLIEVAALKRVGLQREVLVCAEIVDPKLFGPRRFAGGLPVEKQHVCLDALSVEDPGWKPQQRVDVAFVKELPAHGFPRTALKEHVVGNYDGRTSVDFQDRLDVLHEVQLLIRGGGPEVITHHGEGLALLIPFLVHKHHARLLAKRWVGQHDIEAVVRGGVDAALAPDDWWVGFVSRWADPV